MNVTYSVFSTPHEFKLEGFNILEPKILKLWKEDRCSNMRCDDLHLEHIQAFMDNHSLMFNYNSYPKEMIIINEKN